MNLFQWIKYRFGKNEVSLSGKEMKEAAEDYREEAYTREFALFSCLSLIVKAVGKCEFKTFRNGVEFKGDDYYQWNVEPNKNQNASAFLTQAIGELFLKNECLIVSEGKGLFVAECFSRTEHTIDEDVFEVSAIGSDNVRRVYRQSEVIYFTLGARSIRSVLSELYATYADLLRQTKNAYRLSRGRRGILEIDSFDQGDEGKRAAAVESIRQRFQTFFTADNSVVPLPRGYKYEDIGSKTYSSENTRDIRALIDDVGDFTAKAFGIPPVLLRGDVQGTSDALGQFLTFCIDPLCDMMQEEINRKQFGKDEVLAGNFLKIDTRTIRHMDLLSIATPIEKLVSSAVYSVNEVRALIGEQPINEPWANEHHITKNFTPVSKILALGGGDKA